MNSVEPDYRYIEGVYSYEHNHENNTDIINNEDPAFLFIGVSTLFCFYFCTLTSFFVPEMLHKRSTMIFHDTYFLMVATLQYHMFFQH